MSHLIPLGIESAWLSTSQLHTDNRGNFREWFKAKDLEEQASQKFQVQQANISVSARGVLRGIHYSLAKSGQAKWITCVAGSILEVIIDIRPNSPTYKKWISIELDSMSGQAVLIGAGLGHGFVSLQDGTVVAYLVRHSHQQRSSRLIHSIQKLELSGCFQPQNCFCQIKTKTPQI